MSAHTPGPWRKGRCPQSVVADAPVPEIRGSDDVIYYGGHLIAESVATQNIPLIAAAPELLAALKVVTAHLASPPPSNRGWNAALNMAEAAIAKAEGRA
jgi:hypothetical protein